jgi:hypothetical protein
MIPLKQEEIIKGNGIGINKNNKELIAKITKIIEDLKTKRFMKQREMYWFKKN